MNIRKHLEETGLIALYHSPPDTKLLCIQRFVRVIAFGSSTLVLASYLSELGNSDTQIGLFMTLTLVGDIPISFLLTLFADRLGRKAVLAAGSLLMTASGITFACTGNFWLLLVASIFGVITPSGNEVGPFRAVEESSLAHLTPAKQQSDIFAWYTLIGYAGNAIGNLCCGWLVERLRVGGWNVLCAYRAAFYLYAGLGVVQFAFSMALSRGIELDIETKEVEEQDEVPAETQGLLEGQIIEPPLVNKPKLGLFSIAKEKRKTYLQLPILLGIDALGFGILPVSWVTYFFVQKFHIDEGHLGSMFALISIVCVPSILIASSVAKRIGNVKAMSFLHIPSDFLVACIPIPSIVLPAMLITIVRSAFNTMDLAPRSAFLAQIIEPEKRTAVIGVINIIRTIATSLGPIVTGLLVSKGLFWVVFVMSGAFYLVYDLGMLVCFIDFDRERKEEDLDEQGEDDGSSP